jgi:hypothetical protein
MGSCTSKKIKNSSSSSSLEDEIVQELKIIENSYKPTRRYSEPNKIIVYPLYNTRPRRKIRSLSEN